MSRGSVRQKGNKWYYRFYMELEDGQRIQREFAGGRNKRETEAMLRHAMEEYERNKFIASPGNMKLRDLLDMWVEESLKMSSKSNGTIMLYQNTVNRIKQHPIADCRLKTISTDQLQTYLDGLAFGHATKEQSAGRPLAASTVRAYTAVLKGAFAYGVFPKKLLSQNPMAYVVQHSQPPTPLLFDQAPTEYSRPIVSHSQYLGLCHYLKGHPALLPIQIAYYTGLRVGEVCALTWEDIHLDKNYLTVRRTLYYNHATHHTELDLPKGQKCRTVDFGEKLSAILQEAFQRKISFPFANYYSVTYDQIRKHYELHSLPSGETAPENYVPIQFICLQPNGLFQTPDYLGRNCRKIAAKLENMKGFHFHMLRHSFTSNLIQNGVPPKEVQELLGHSDIRLTLNVYAHTNRKSRQTSVKVLDHLSESP